MEDSDKKVIDGSPGEDDHMRFNQLIMKGKRYVEEGSIEKALKCNQRALDICYNEKLARKIKKMEAYLAAQADESEDEDGGMIHVGKGFHLYKDLYNNLYHHQQEGVLWLWSLYRRKKGGILGDDMGLGKTIQVIGFLYGMFDMQKIQSVLIVLPVAVMVNWEKEFNKWAPGLKVVAYHGNSKKEKERALARIHRRGGVCLTTYGLVVTSSEQLGTMNGREFVWDYIILDEGHKIKNPTKTSKGVHAIAARNRVILTGTPVQNNLKELWSLFDFVHQGSLLGTQRTFKMEFENPITRAREKDATVGEKKLGLEMAEALKKMIEPYFLRRTKQEVKDKQVADRAAPPDSDKSQRKHATMPSMTRKNDLIVWTFLKETQLNIYRDFLELDSVKELLMTSKSPLVALNVLKKICDHPRLLSTRACAQLGIEGDEGLDENILETEEGNMSAVTRIQHVADGILVQESGKLVFLVQLLDQLKAEGHRCLVFSQSRKMLDIMQKVIGNRGHKIMRLDGTISSVQEREQRIQKFQTDNSYSVFLLTTQVGGVGLTLTAADRVVIYDPSWNPATDAQAVDRVFRIGQDKNVVIYRLITCGTVEEKIYRRQIFKDSITRQTTGNAKNPYRYFSKYELRELFTLDDPHSSSTQQQLESMHSGERLTDPSLDEHIAYLYSLEMFGLSDHDLMFSGGSEAGDRQDLENSDEEGQQAGNQPGGTTGHENDYILHRVQKAREIIEMESSQAGTLEERQGKGPQQGSVGASVGRNMFQNWQFGARQGEEDTDRDQDDDKENEVPMVDLTQVGTPPPAERVKQEPETVDLTTPVPEHPVTIPSVVVIKKNGLDGATFPLKSKQCLFGRGDNCMIKLLVPEVGLEHCRLEINSPSEVDLVLLGKDNPVSVNGKQVLSGRVRLQHMDVFTIVSRLFRLELPAHMVEQKSIKTEPDLEIIGTPKIKHEDMETNTGSPVRRLHSMETTPLKVRPGTSQEDNAMEVGTPVRHTPLTLQDLNTSRPVSSPHRRRSVAKGLTPHKHRDGTPGTQSLEGCKIVREDILISPNNSGGPVIQTTRTSVPNLSSLSIGSAEGFQPKFHSTVFGATDTPDNQDHDDNSHSSTGSNNQSIFAVDSPAVTDSSHRKPLHTIIQDSPANTPLNTSNKSKKSSADDTDSDEEVNPTEHGDVDDDLGHSVQIDESLIESDGDEKENMEPANISVHELRNILEKSLSHKNDDIRNRSVMDSPTRDVHNVSHRVNESFSDDDDDGNDSGDDVNDDDIDVDDDVVDSDGEQVNNDSSRNELSHNSTESDSSSLNQTGARYSGNFNTTEDGDHVAMETGHNAVDGGHEAVNDGTGQDQMDGIGADTEDDYHEADDDDQDDDEEEDEEGSEEEIDEFSLLPEEDQVQYNELVERARELCQNKDYEVGLAHVLQALEIFADPDLQATAINIQKKIAKRQARMQTEQS